MERGGIESLKRKRFEKGLKPALFVKDLLNRKRKGESQETNGKLL